MAEPTLDIPEKYDITYSYAINEFEMFWESYVDMNPMSYVTEHHIGWILIPRSTVEYNSVRLFQAFRKITIYGAVISGASFEYVSYFGA